MEIIILVIINSVFVLGVGALLARTMDKQQKNHAAEVYGLANLVDNLTLRLISRDAREAVLAEAMHEQVHRKEPPKQDLGQKAQSIREQLAGVSGQPLQSMEDIVQEDIREEKLPPNLEEV